MKYFLHDTSAFQDEKVSELFQSFGYEGIGLFYTVLEKLALQEKPIKTSVLKAQLNVGKRLEKCWSFMESLGIISSSNGETFNERILSYSEKYQIKKEKTRIKVAEFRDRQVDTENVTGYMSECNHPKVKESKVKESKEIVKGLRPTADFEISLSETSIGAAIEYFKFAKQQDVTKELVLSLFTVFKQKHFTGAKFYANESDIITHFLQSLKYEKLENGTHKQSSGIGKRGKSAGSSDFLSEIKEYAGAVRGSNS